MREMIACGYDGIVSYDSPVTKVLDLNPEGVLCGSGTEEIEYLDGEW